jgi:hypothetical protein
MFSDAGEAGGHRRIVGAWLGDSRLSLWRQRYAARWRRGHISPIGARKRVASLRLLCRSRSSLSSSRNLSGEHGRHDDRFWHPPSPSPWCNGTQTLYHTAGLRMGRTRLRPAAWFRGGRQVGPPLSALWHGSGGSAHLQQSSQQQRNSTAFIDSTTSLSPSPSSSQTLDCLAAWLLAGR